MKCGWDSHLNHWKSPSKGSMDQKTGGFSGELIIKPLVDFPLPYHTRGYEEVYHLQSHPGNTGFSSSGPRTPWLFVCFFQRLSELSEMVHGKSLRDVLFPVDG